MIKAIIFDYDGVIVDSFPVVHEIYLKICGELGKKCTSDFNDFKKIYGYNSREFAKNQGFSEEEVKKADVIYRREIVKINPPLFEGIGKVIKDLKKRYKIILITSSPRFDVTQKLKLYDLYLLFDKIYASDIAGPMKKPKAILDTLESFGLDKNEIIFIGDRTIDFDEAREADIPSKNIFLVDYGWGYDSEKVPKQKFVINRPQDILKAVEDF